MGMKRLAVWLVGVTGLLMGLQIAAQEASPIADTHCHFSFDQADIRTVTRMIGDITKKRFVVAGDVEGKLTVVSPPIPKQDAYRMFVSVIASAGCTVIEDGDVMRVVKLPGTHLNVGPIVGPDDVVTQQGVLTKVFRLEHVSADEIRRLLSVQADTKGGVAVLEESNLLVVTDTASVISRVATLISKVDQPGLARKRDVVTLQFAEAQALAMQLNKALFETESRATRLANRLPSTPGSSGSRSESAGVVAVPHSNALILMGTQRQIDDLKALIVRMDVDVPSGRGSLNAIFVRYINAENVAKSISGLLERSAANSSDPGARRKIAVQADTINNAILVDATPTDFQVVKELVEQLDREPELVHISVMIAEVEERDGFEFGVEFTALNTPEAVGDTAIAAANRYGTDSSGILDGLQNGLFPQGLTVGLAKGAYTDADGNLVLGYPGILRINALKEDGRIEILSETSLEAQNNHEATVSIVDEIPILSSTIQGGSGASRDVIQNIERIDVGVKLKMTPHIIPGGKVRVELHPSIEAVTDSGDDPNGLTPTIAKREVNTTVTVPNQQTIVIAGLTRRDTIKVDKKYPLLGSIPLIGWLFRSTQESEKVTNLLIFVTPTIIGSREDADAVTARWRKKTGLTGNELDPPEDVE